MTVKDYNDFALLLSERSNLLNVIHFRMFLNLASTLNRGCKCNKDKLKEQVEQSYKTVLLKKKDDELFQKEIKQLLTNNEEESITFYYKEEEIFSLRL